MTDANEQDLNEAHRQRMVEVKKQQDEQRKLHKIDKGLLLVNTGDGKGKSTSGFGLAMRAAGHGFHVAVIQFTKGKWKTGEAAAFKRFPEIEHFIVGDGFTWDTQNRAADIEAATQGFAVVKACIEASRVTEENPKPKYDLIVLDELNIITGYGYLPVAEVVATLQDRPPKLHVLVTGRGASDGLIAIADTVTRMDVVKHAYQNGVRAQRGIEF
jgi:cob(I)alamin adenosyltransferase